MLRRAPTLIPISPTSDSSTFDPFRAASGDQPPNLIQDQGRTPDMTRRSKQAEKLERGFAFCIHKKKSLNLGAILGQTLHELFPKEKRWISRHINKD